MAKAATYDEYESFVKECDLEEELLTNDDEEMEPNQIQRITMIYYLSYVKDHHGSQPNREKFRELVDCLKNPENANEYMTVMKNLLRLCEKESKEDAKILNEHLL